MVAVTLGTGVGGGIISDGRMITGQQAQAARSVISTLRMRKRSAVAAAIRAVWRSMPPLPAWYVWPGDVWQRMTLPVCFVKASFLQRQYLTQ